MYHVSTCVTMSGAWLFYKLKINLSYYGTAELYTEAVVSQRSNLNKSWETKLNKSLVYKILKDARRVEVGL